MAIKAPWGHVWKLESYSGIVQEFGELISTGDPITFGKSLVQIGGSYAMALFDPPEGSPKDVMDSLVEVGERAAELCGALFKLGPRARAYLPNVTQKDLMPGVLYMGPVPISAENDVFAGLEPLWVYLLSNNLERWKRAQWEANKKRLNGGRTPNLAELDLVLRCAELLDAADGVEDVPKLARRIHEVVTREKLPKNSQKFRHVWKDMCRDSQAGF